MLSGKMNRNGPEPRTGVASCDEKYNMRESLPQSPLSPAWSDSMIPGSLPDLFTAYQPPSQAYDEVYAAPGQPRNNWLRFLADLNRLGRRRAGTPLGASQAAGL